MTTIGSLFSHELEVRLPALLLVHIYKGLIAVLMLGEVGTNLLTDLEVSVGGAIELVRECAEEAVAVPEGVDRIKAHLRQLVFQPLLVLHGIVDNLDTTGSCPCPAFRPAMTVEGGGGGGA